MNYLYVIRDDGEYDYKAHFQSYSEANDYRQRCQRRWINHCDYVMLRLDTKEYNLTELPIKDIKRLLNKADIDFE